MLVICWLINIVKFRGASTPGDVDHTHTVPLHFLPEPEDPWVEANSYVLPSCVPCGNTDVRIARKYRSSSPLTLLRFRVGCLEHIRVPQIRFTWTRRLMWWTVQQLVRRATVTWSWQMMSNTGKLHPSPSHHGRLYLLWPVVASGTNLLFHNLRSDITSFNSVLISLTRANFHD